MAQHLRGKQAGVQRDLSEGLLPELFALDKVARYGINSQIAALAYEPVQSLLAVGTSESHFGRGQIYVFGRNRVFSILGTARPASIKSLQFCADRLLAIDSKNDVTIFSLNTKKIEASYTPPGSPCSLLTDPTLDYAFIGLQNGEVLAYDMDRCGLAQLRISSLWRTFNAKARHMPVIALALHPRDIGTLLIVYAEGAVTYSFKQNKALMFFHYELPRGAPGGFPDPASKNTVRFPKMVQGTWHPTGTFILTAHDDESLVVWDPKTGKIVHARTLQDTNVNQVGQTAGSFGSSPGTFALKAPISRLAWCSKKNPDDTGILVAGGCPTNIPNRGLTFCDLGLTPVYQTSSWQVLSGHFERPKDQKLLVSPPNADVVDFCLIPRDSPYFSMAHDPIAAIALLGSGELISLSFPSGFPISPTNILHPSLTFVHPFVSMINVSSIERTRWLGMTEKRSTGPPILRGGSRATRPLMRFGDRNVLQSAHADGTVRIWDAGHGGEVENESLIQVDVARALGGALDPQVLRTSMSGAGELAIGMRTGEVVVFRWGRNIYAGQELKAPRNEHLGLIDIADRAEPDVREGFLPLTLFAKKTCPVSALQISDVGFVAAGFENGSLLVVDLRGPAVILDTQVSQTAKASQRLSIRRSASNQTAKSESVSAISFGVLSLEGEEYSSILLFAGTSLGRLVTFKLLPQSNGAFKTQDAGSAGLDGQIISILPLDADSGRPAHASQKAVAGLRDGQKTNGVLIVATPTEVRIFKPAASKGAHKSWGDAFCYAAQVVRRDDRSSALIGLFGDGTARTFLIPSLREVYKVRIDEDVDMQRLPDAIITPLGDIFAWKGPAEIVVLNSWGSGVDSTKSKDKLTDPELLIPPRPTISNVQWISGTQHFTASDLDVLVGGSDRPPSKQMVEQMRIQQQQSRGAGSSTPTPGTAPASQSGEGYWAYMQRQIQERTERLNVMGDSIDKLEESSSNWADDVNKFVSKQKKKAVMGMIGSKFGL